jgi:subtilisin family serine protease
MKSQFPSLTCQLSTSRVIQRATLAMLTIALSLSAVAIPPAPLQLRGQPGKTYVIEASDDLRHWTPIKTTQADAVGRVLFTDPQAGNFRQRFYRGRLSAANLLGGPHDSGRVLVKPKNGITLADVSALNATLGVTRLKTFPQMGNLQVVQTPGNLTAATLIDQYRRSGLVQYAEHDYFLHLQLEPNDVHYQDGSMWNLHNAGQFGGTADADIDAVEAWDTITSAANVIVAVIDTGMRYTHEDLAPNMWVNAGEIPGNGVDDDGNGYVDDVFGINAIANNEGTNNAGYTDAGDPNDDLGHGTHVAGTIGAAGNNLVGVAGVCWRVQLMALKAFKPDGLGTLSDAIECIDYARAKGAHVINASWGANWFTSEALQDAIASARDAGIIFSAAAGNAANDNDVAPVYPASYDLDNIVAVAATTRTDELAAFSNFGATSVDLAAPGTEIGSCWNSSDTAYQIFAGTSTATPHVSGVAALLRAFYPDEDYRQIINRILAAVDVLPTLAEKCATGGRLNAQKALGTSSPSLPVITVAATDASASEAGDPGTFIITRTGSTAAALTVNYTLGGSASNGLDYESLPATATIPAGSSSTMVTVTPLADSATEGSETVTLTVSANSAYTVGSLASATVTIAEEPLPSDDPVLTLSVVDPNGAETGPDPGVIRFHRTGDPSQPVQVNWTFSGTAVNGSDFQELPTTYPFPEGLEADLTITPIDDAIAEGSETVIVTLVDGPGYTVGTPNTATITITDNDDGPPLLPTVTVTASDPDAAEPSNTGTYTFSRSGSTSSSLTVNYSLNGTAENGVDYQTLSGSVTIASGSSSATATVTPIDDSAMEGDETVVLTLSANSAYTLGSSNNATVTIDDDDAPPPPLPTVAVAATDASASESGGTGTFTISRSGSTASSLSVNYSMSGGAQNGTDYQNLSGSITIASGSSSANITVTPIDDSVVEGDETAILTLTASATYTVGSPGSATVTITDNDEEPPPPLPTVTVTANDPNAAEPSNTGTFAVSRTGSTNSSLTVNYSLNGTAQNGVDYQTLSGSVTIASGSSSANITVTPIDDSADENNETVVLTLSANSAYTVGSPSSATVSIADNDEPPPPLPTVNVTASDASASESGGTGRFTVSRNGSTSASLTVRYTMSGSAQNGTDYQTLSGSVTIASGSSSANITVMPIDDSVDENNETVILTLSANSAYTVGSPSSATVSIADNDEPPPALVADFTASSLLGLVPLVVEFTDRSTGNPVSWNWNFGDGATSTARHPTHIYLIPGHYTVTLTVRNSAGATSSKSAVIRATLL